MQSAPAVLLVRPVRFGYNPQTAFSNHFQHQLPGFTPAQVQVRARAEFEEVVVQLRAHGVQVVVVDDTPEPLTPDSIFPNNWLTLHADGRVLLYPMCASNRRAERRPEVLAALAPQFAVKEVLDLSASEQEGRFLEGTGSLIFDHAHRVAYACRSPRTDVVLVREVAARLGYRAVLFSAEDAQGHAIYHTNVMLSIGPGFAVLCAESIPDATERATVEASLQTTGHELICISQAQVAGFAGNVLALQPAGGQPVLALSQQAWAAFTPAQQQRLASHARPLPLAIPTIETIGGGSVRCMLAEIFLPEKPA